MGYRYTEEELATIKARQATNLASFQRNSGRGLPAPTVKAMEKADGLKRDEHGAPVPKKASTARAKALLAGLPPPRGKYSNEITEVDGIKFHSKLEANYYVELELRRKAKEVLFFLRQVAFPLPGGVVYRLDFLEVGYHTGYTGCEQQRCEGALDLRNFEPFWIRYIDTKGHETREGKNKIKMVQALYGIKITLVRKVKRQRTT
jgi:Protein of unknown function (DUF1064)